MTTMGLSIQEFLFIMGDALFIDDYGIPEQKKMLADLHKYSTQWMQ